MRLSAMSRMPPKENNIQKSHEKQLSGRPTCLNYKEERRTSLEKAKKEKTELNQL